MKKIILILIPTTLLLLGIWLIPTQRPASQVELDESSITRRFTQDGTTYVVHQGDFYKDHRNGSYSFIETYYQTDFYDQAYTVKDDAIFVHSPDDPSMQIRIRNEFHDDFEKYDSVQDLIISNESIAGKEKLIDGVKTYDPLDLPTRWMTLILQSPKSPGVKDYVELRKKIEAGGDFVENRVEPSTEQARSGKRSIRFFSVAPLSSMACSKSSVASSAFHFEKGDDFWFSGWFYFEKGMPLTVMDLESTWLLKHSGIRILFSESGNPCVELKAFEKPTWRNNDYAVPRNQWVNIKAHFYLDEQDGRLALWIDDQLVIEGTGQTLPLADTILDSVEVGISATLKECVVYLDDIAVTDNPEGFLKSNADSSSTKSQTSDSR